MKNVIVITTKLFSLFQRNVTWENSAPKIIGDVTFTHHPHHTHTTPSAFRYQLSEVWAVVYGVGPCK